MDLVSYFERKSNESIRNIEFFEEKWKTLFFKGRMRLIYREWLDFKYISVGDF